MTAFINIIERLVSTIGSWSAWLCFILIFVVCGDVMMRYVWSTSPNWLIELEWHLFSLIFLLGSAYCLQQDKHVRVDVFYTKWSIKTKAWVNIIGTLLLLLPWCFIVTKTSSEYAINSFYMNEGSDQPGGLPARYVIKFAIVVGFVLLALQGLANILKNVKLIKS